MTAQQEIIDSLRGRGIKVTPQRLAIIEYLLESRTHPTADEIFQYLNKKFPSLSAATVYNTLEMLEEIDRIIKLKIADANKVNYDYNTTPHHHFFCKSCHKIYDVPIPCQIAEQREVDGHQVDEVHGYFKGVCSDCRPDSDV